MKKKLGIAVIFALVVLGAFFMFTTAKYNEMVNQEEDLNRSYGVMQSIMQQAFEKIPNMVEAVKGETKFEKDTFIGVAEARSKAGGQINIDPSKIANDPNAQKNLAEAQNSLAQTFSRLMSVQEKYPELKANKAFQDLRTEISGMANKTNRAREATQAALNSYNKNVRFMPGQMVALIYGFKPKPYYQAAPEAQSGSGLVKF